MLFTNSILAAMMAMTAAAHPGHSVAQEIQERRDYLATTKIRDLSHCAAKLKARGLEERNVERRSELIEKARAKRGLKKRTLETVLATDHNETANGYTQSTDAATLFSGYSSCVLTPDVTQGRKFLISSSLEAYLPR